jgi:hypothetical protein
LAALLEQSFISTLLSKTISCAPRLHSHQTEALGLFGKATLKMETGLGFMRGGSLFKKIFSRMEALEQSSFLKETKSV